MARSVGQKGHVPHWGWLLVWTILFVVACVPIVLGVRIYRLQRLLADLRARGCWVECHDPHWLLTWSQIEKEDLTVIFSSSVSINANYKTFTDEDLSRVTALTNLEALKLNGTQISDRGLLLLGRLGKLRNLALAGTPITDRGLAHLAGLDKLRYLLLSRTQVTAAGVAKLQTALPEINIEGP